VSHNVCVYECVLVFSVRCELDFYVYYVHCLTHRCCADNLRSIFVYSNLNIFFSSYVQTIVTGIRTRRRKQLLGYVKETRGYCKLKETALDRAAWWTGFGRVCRPVVEQTVDWKNEECFNNKIMYLALYIMCTALAFFWSLRYVIINTNLHPV